MPHPSFNFHKIRFYLPEPADHETRRFQILSLDGGGIKGLFSAAVLAAIEQDLAVRIVDHFDLITGTSTGGIIALGLGLGLSPRDLVDFYVKLGPRIFGNRLWYRSWLHYVWRKFPQGPLKCALCDPATFGERLLGDSTKRLVIPAYSLDADDVYIFKTPHHERLRRDWKVPAWKVALATSAAPTYFPACCHVDSCRLIDGGVWANNPTMVGIIEAKSVLGVPLDQIRVLSLGTIDPIARRSSSLKNGGLFQWRTDAVDIIMRGQSVGVQRQVSHLLGEDAVTRLDPRAPQGVFKLDQCTPESLIAIAAHESRKFSPTFCIRFQEHLAPTFAPAYKTNTKEIERD